MVLYSPIDTQIAKMFLPLTAYVRRANSYRSLLFFAEALTLSRKTNFGLFQSSKLIYFADGNFKLDENGRKFSKTSENTVGKGEISRYMQFLHFPQCFQKTFTADT